MANDNMLIITLAGTAIAVLLYVIHQLRRRRKEKENNNDGGAAAEMENQTSKPTPSGQSYEVFLSFRGDIRNIFTDHLYTRLVDAGILVFRDNEKLPVGETIGTELCKAIKASEISIPIISPNFASSKWCLNELVQMLICMKTSGQRVLPIFYNVEPSDVRHQKGSFGKAFELYIKKHDFDGKLIQEWKNALTEVSSLKGWESSKVADGREGELVKRVVTKVFKELRKAILVVPDLLVGIEDHVKNIMRMIEVKPLDEVKIIGIYGMGGIGKTTLAKVIYNKLCKNFEYRSFVSDIREASSQHRGMEGLQEQVMDMSWMTISNIDEGITNLKMSFKRKKLLLLLDDVEDTDQLNKLAADPCWFGPQSIIIITTRNKEVIEGLESSLPYELNALDYDQSFHLFRKHAFGKNDSPSVELETIAKDIVLNTGGLPLAIEVIGSLLCQKSKDTWKHTLKKLKEIPDDKVQEKLRISYDALKHEEQQIFLDIACLLFKGRREYASYMWDGCGFYPILGIQSLISFCLIKIGDKDQLIIHDQLRDLGREIVRRESYHELGKRSRVWIPEDALEVVQQKQGTKKVQALHLDGCYEKFTKEHFEELTNLRFLKMQKTSLVGNFKNSLPKLRWLEWNGYSTLKENTTCHLEDFLATIHSKKLVVLDLSYAKFANHWKSWGQIELARGLKVLNLYSCNFTTTPDFSAMRELEILKLSHCNNLIEIHPSICNLNNSLKILHVRYCYKLEELPKGVGKMEELREFLIDGTRVREIPISKGFMTKLEKLSANSELTHVPDSIGSLEMLRSLSLEYCQLLTKIPGSIGKLKSLTELHLGCTGVTELPDSLGDVRNLKSLNMRSISIKRLPSNIGMLSNLQALNLDQCRKLESLPIFPCSLTSLKFHGDSMETIPDISYLTNLEELKYCDAFERRNRALSLGKLNQLNTLQIFHSRANRDGVSTVQSSFSQLVVPEDINSLLELELPCSLVKLQVRECQTLRHLPNMLNLKRLTDLLLEDCRGLMEINGVEGAESLTFLLIKRCQKLTKLSGLGVLVRRLSLDSCPMLKSLPNLATAKNLKCLRIEGCDNLVEIPGLDHAECLQDLSLSSCSSLKRIGDLSNLKMLETLELLGCEKLSVVEGIDKLTSLETLQFYVYNPKVKFPDLSKLRNLKNLKIRDERLVEIPGLQELKSLVELHIIGCKSLRYLPDFSLFTNLQYMSADHCENLTLIQGLENLKSFRRLGIYGCRPRVSPDLPKEYVFGMRFSCGMPIVLRETSPPGSCLRSTW